MCAAQEEQSLSRAAATPAAPLSLSGSVSLFVSPESFPTFRNSPRSRTDRAGPEPVSRNLLRFRGFPTMRADFNLESPWLKRQTVIRTADYSGRFCMDCQCLTAPPIRPDERRSRSGHSMGKPYPTGKSLSGVLWIRTYSGRDIHSAEVPLSASPVWWWAPCGG